jgi:hypothetical protein
MGMFYQSSASNALIIDTATHAGTGRQLAKKLSFCDISMEQNRTGAV